MLANEVKIKLEFNLVQLKLLRKGIENLLDIKIRKFVYILNNKSKFFINVREKQSLCYYCVSRYQRAKGIMTVESGVEFENIEKTKNAVLQELDAIRKGDVTDDELNFAKLSISNDFVSICDTVGGIGEWYISQLADGRMLSVKEAIDDFNSVTKEQVIEAANKVTLDTVYVLRGE